MKNVIVSKEKERKNCIEKNGISVIWSNQTGLCLMLFSNPIHSVTHSLTLSLAAHARIHNVLNVCAQPSAPCQVDPMITEACVAAWTQPEPTEKTPERRREQTALLSASFPPRVSACVAPSPTASPYLPRTSSPMRLQ